MSVERPFTDMSSEDPSSSGNEAESPTHYPSGGASKNPQQIFNSSAMLSMDADDDDGDERGGNGSSPTPFCETAIASVSKPTSDVSSARSEKDNEPSNDSNSVGHRRRTSEDRKVSEPFAALPSDSEDTIVPRHSKDEVKVERKEIAEGLTNADDYGVHIQGNAAGDTNIEMAVFTTLAPGEAPHESDPTTTTTTAGRNTSAKNRSALGEGERMKHSERNGHVSIREPEDLDRHASSSKTNKISFDEEDLQNLLDACTHPAQRKRLKRHFRKFKDRNEKLQVLEQTATALKVRNDNLESVILDGSIVVREAVRRQSGSSSALFLPSQSTRSPMNDFKASKSSPDIVDHHTLVEEFITPLLFPGKSQRGGRSIAEIVGLNTDSPLPFSNAEKMDGGRHGRVSDTDESEDPRTGGAGNRGSNASTPHSKSNGHVLDDSIVSDEHSSEDVDVDFAPPMEDAPAESLAFTPMDPFFGASSTRSGAGAGIHNDAMDDEQLSPHTVGLKPHSSEADHQSPPAIHVTSDPQGDEKSTAMPVPLHPTVGDVVPSALLPNNPGPFPFHTPTSPMTPMRTSARGARKVNSPAVSTKAVSSFVGEHPSPPLLATLSPHVRQQYASQEPSETLTPIGSRAMNQSTPFEETPSHPHSSVIPKPPLGKLHLSNTTSTESSMKSVSGLPLPANDSISVSSVEDVTLVCLLMLSTLSKQHYTMIHSLVTSSAENAEGMQSIHRMRASLEALPPIEGNERNETYKTTSNECNTSATLLSSVRSLSTPRGDGHGKGTHILSNHNGWWINIPITGSVYSDVFNLSENGVGHGSGLTGDGTAHAIHTAMKSPRPSLQIPKLSCVSRALVMSWQRSEENKSIGHRIDCQSAASIVPTGRRASPSPLLSLSWSKLLLPSADEVRSLATESNPFLSHLSLGSMMCEILARVSGSVCIPFGFLSTKKIRHDDRKDGIIALNVAPNLNEAVNPSGPSSAVSSPLRSDATATRKPKQGTGQSFLPEIPSAAPALSPISKGKRLAPTSTAATTLKGAIATRTGSSNRANRSRKGSFSIGRQSRGNSAHVRGNDSAADAKALEAQEKLEWFTAAEDLFQIVETAVTQTFPVVLETCDPTEQTEGQGTLSALQSLLPPSTSNPPVAELPPAMRDKCAYWIVGSYRGNLAETGPRYASSTRSSESITDANTRWVCMCDVQSAAAAISHAKILPSQLPRVPSPTKVSKAVSSKGSSNTSGLAGKGEAAGREGIPVWRYMQRSNTSKPGISKGSNRKGMKDDDPPSSWKSSKSKVAPQLVSTGESSTLSSRRTSLTNPQAGLSSMNRKAVHTLGFLERKSGASDKSTAPSPAGIPRYSLFWIRWSDLIRLVNVRAAMMNPSNYKPPCAVPCHPSWWDMRVRGNMRCVPVATGSSSVGQCPLPRGSESSSSDPLPSIALEVTVNRATQVYATLHMYCSGSTTSTDVNHRHEMQGSTNMPPSQATGATLNDHGRKLSSSEGMQPHRSFSLVCTECQGGHQQVLYGHDNLQGTSDFTSAMNFNEVGQVSDCRIQADGGLLVTACRVLQLTPEHSPYYIFPQMLSTSSAPRSKQHNKEDSLDACGGVKAENSPVEWSYVLGLQVDYDSPAGDVASANTNANASPDAFTSAAAPHRRTSDTNSSLPALSPSSTPMIAGRPRKGERAANTGATTAPNSAMIRHGGFENSLTGADGGLNGSIKRKKDERTSRKAGQNKTVIPQASASATSVKRMKKIPSTDPVEAFGTPLTVQTANLSTTDNPDAFSTPFTQKETGAPTSEVGKKSQLELAIHFKNIDRSAILLHGAREFIATSACVKPADTMYQIKSPDGTLFTGSGNSLS